MKIVIVMAAVILAVPILPSCSCEIQQGEDTAVFRGENTLEVSPYLYANPGDEIKITVTSEKDAPVFITGVWFIPDEDIGEQWTEQTLYSGSHSWAFSIPEMKFGTRHTDKKIFKIKIPENTTMPVHFTVKMSSEYAKPFGASQYTVGYSDDAWDVKLGMLQNTTPEDAVKINDWQIDMHRTTGFTLQLDYSSIMDFYIEITDPENKMWIPTDSPTGLLEQKEPDIMETGNNRERVSFLQPEAKTIKYRPGDTYTLAIRERYTGYLLRTEKLVYQRDKVSIEAADILWGETDSQGNHLNTIKMTARNEGRWAVPLNEVYVIIKSPGHLSSWESPQSLCFLNKGETIVEVSGMDDLPIPEGEKTLYITLLSGKDTLGSYLPFNDESLREYTIATLQQKLPEPE